MGIWKFAKGDSTAKTRTDPQGINKSGKH